MKLSQYENNIYVHFISEMTYVNILVFLVVTSDCTMYILYIQLGQGNFQPSHAK